MILERVARPLPTVGDFLRALDRHLVANATVAFLFSGTGPLVILLAVTTKAGFSREDIASWIFAGYALGGALSIIMSVLYRQPLGMAWTIPGGVLIGPALEHLTFPEVVGAYMVTGVLLLALGLSGWVRRVMTLVPMPIVMGMVSGVFLPFGLRIISGFADDVWIALAMVVAFFAAAAVPAIGRILPPVLAALVVGVVAVLATGHIALDEPVRFALASPKIFIPRFSVQAILELVVPLAVTVIGIQNSQGFAVLTATGFKPPINAATAMCGIGTLAFGIFGSVPACVTGPANAIICSSTGHDEKLFAGGVIFGVLMLVYGMLAPIAAQLGLALPTAFIGVLGGLALARVLQGSLVSAFGGELSLGALATFLVTLSGMTLLNIGAAFWGLVFGMATSWLLERDALRKAWRG